MLAKSPVPPLFSINTPVSLCFFFLPLQAPPKWQDNITPCGRNTWRKINVEENNVQSPIDYLNFPFVFPFPADKNSHKKQRPGQYKDLYWTVVKNFDNEHQEKTASTKDLILLASKLTPCPFNCACLLHTFFAGSMNTQDHAPTLGINKSYRRGLMTLTIKKDKITCLLVDCAIPYWLS